MSTCSKSPRRSAPRAPQPPLAWNQDLANAAQSQSQYEASNQVQSHTGSDGSTTSQRIQQAGYGNATSNGENTYAYGTSVMESMQAFLMDWGVPSDGHRINIQQPGVSPSDAYQSVGIGMVSTNNASVGPMVVTQDFGSQSNAQAQLVGVAYTDNNGSNFYQPGEGQGGIQIDAVNLQTGAVSSTQTWDSGGYELSLAPGQYRIIASQNDTVIQTSTITMNNVNVEQDFILNNASQGGSRENAIAAAQPANPAPVTPTPTPAPAPVKPQPIAMGVVPAVQSTPQPVATTAPVNQASAPAHSSIMSLFNNSWSAWNAKAN